TEVDRHVAAIETDSGAGRPLGLGTKAGPGGIDALRDLLAPTLAPIGARRFREGHGGSDIAPLEDYGVPLIGLELDGTRYFDWHHTQADTLDKVDPGELQLGVAAMAATAWSLADAPVTLPRNPKKGAAVGGSASLIPRVNFFGNPAKDFPQISPTGGKLAWLAPSSQGVQNLWVKTLGRQDDAQVTRDNHAGIFFYRWAADGRHLLFLQDSDGDENYHLFSIDLETGDVRDLTPFAGVKAQNLLLSPSAPGEVLIGLNRRDRHLFDMYRVNLETGAVSLDTQNPGDVLGWATDNRFVIRAATVFEPATARTVLRVRDAADKPWRELAAWPFELSSMFGQINGGSVVAGFTPDGSALYVVSATGSDMLRLVTLDAATGRQLRVVAEDPRADVAQDALGFNDMRPAVEFNPTTREIQAVEFDYMKPEWKVIDPSVKADFELLAASHRGALLILSRDAADQHWVVAHAPDNGPRVFSLYDRKTRRLEPLFVDHPEMEKLTLAEATPVEIPARDGQKLVAYLTLPPGSADKARPSPAAAHRLPLILFPHGGPWARDVWGFDPVAQWLASRGYAVLQVNFRGSTGYGRKFLNASTGQWGVGAMQHDLTDSVKWAIAKGIADSGRVGIMGYSYGGYATLSGLAFTPELYACGVDIVGPPDVAALMASMPDAWAPVKKRWILRIGDVEHDAALNQRISPLYHLDSMRAPLLIGHGANDPRVKIEASNRIVAALREKNLPVTYIVYPDEGHGFGRPENNLDFFGRAEEFLGKCLGGRVEPWVKVEGSTAEPR
ncbi:MAG TPA: prolyl oligopeptidase family serine peptidase, partial [Patescibacteria group bacterium]|nr:prolyl oligopeptidase family serine peptidase [Patescibacteria group bacterium]